MTSIISKKEQAQMIRKSLKEAFPGVKFSVRGSRGSAINIGWTDGPNTRQVKTVTGRFVGGYFDPMDDSQHSITTKLDGQPVQFSADFIFHDREYSDGMIARVLRRIDSEATVADFRAGRLVDREYRGEPLRWFGIGWARSVQDAAHATLGRRSDRGRGKYSETAARVGQ